MSSKIKVGLIYGGKSPEHEVSKMTAQSIREHIDRDRFDVMDIFIDKNGKLDEHLLDSIDVAFLAVHGPNCEDGKLQKYLEDQGIKYTGPEVEASRLNMDKILEHDCFKKVGLKVVEYKGFRINDDIENIKSYIQSIGLPVFIKPNNGGSSIGMSKVEKTDDISKALNEAFKFDDKICVEKAVKNPREIELAVLGNNDLTISNPGEVLSNGEFYSYETKYFKPFETTSKAMLTDSQISEVKDLARKPYIATGCSGYARIDFLLDGNKFYINEINTLPGFTSISMFPKLMENMGIKYKDLITKIIDLALE
jgi:D-alanine-D-alanine ligase